MTWFFHHFQPSLLGKSPVPSMTRHNLSICRFASPLLCTHPPKNSHGSQNQRWEIQVRNLQNLQGGPRTSRSRRYPPWQWTIHQLQLKMYFLLKMGIFQCHVSFQGCSYRCKSIRSLEHVFCYPLWKLTATAPKKWMVGILVGNFWETIFAGASC